MMAPKLRVEEQDVAGAEEEAEPRDWQIIDLYIDPNECDGYMPNFEGTEATEPPLADAGNAFRQLVEAVSGSCIEVDTGCHGPRVWIQLGAAHCHWSMQGAATVSFTSTSSDDDVHPCTAGQEIKVDGPCQIRIHLNWKGLDCSGEVEPCEPECDLDPCDG